MAELECIGIPGPVALAETLANSADPIEDIRKFQDSAGIQLPSLNAAIPMLDLLDVPRLSFCSTVLDDIQKQLLVRVAELGSSLDAASASARKENVKKLLELLEKCFGLVTLASVRPIVLAVLKALPELPETYLSPQGSKFDSVPVPM